MKRSRAVPLTLVASATTLAACGQEPESLACVERGSNRVVAESLCTAANAPTVQTPAPGTPGATTHAGGGIPPIFLWYFGGRAIGGLMNGGGYAPLSGQRYRSPSGLAYNRGGWTRGSPNRVGGSRIGGGTTRGGFGGIGAGRSGGG